MRVASMLVLFGVLPFTAANLRGQQQPTIAVQALNFIDRQTQAVRNQFYIFKGADSAFNHGFLSGEYHSSADRMDFDASCIYNRLATSGCGGGDDFDPHGSVLLRLAIQSLSGNGYDGLYFQDPESSEAVGLGYDLRTSNEIVFDTVSSFPHPLINFSSGPNMMSSDQTVQSTSNWITVHLPLPGVRNELHVLFGIGAKAPTAQSSLLLRNIYVNPVPQFQRNMLGLPLSFLAFGVTPSAIGTGRVPVPIDQVIMNLATTADSSAALLALVKSKTHLDSAQQIGDSFLYALHHDNQGLPIPLGGESQFHCLRNAYMGGDLMLHSDQKPPANSSHFGRSGDVRLPGFSVPATPVATATFNLVLNGASGGANAMAILALLAASAQFDPVGSDSNKRYLQGAREIGNWIVSQLRDNQGYGGYVVGFPDQGASPDHLIKGKSTADNAIIYSALRSLASTVQDPAEAAVWMQNANAAADFVDQMFDPGTGSFYSGTAGLDDLKNGVAVGTIPDGPRLGADIINIFDYADAQLLPVLALAGSGRPSRTPEDWQSALNWLGPMQRLLTPSGLSGINFVTRPLQQSPDGIAWQYTAQAVLALRQVNSLIPTPQFADRASSYLAGLRSVQLPYDSANQDAEGAIPAATLDRSVPVREACISVPVQCIPARPSLGATAWAILAEINFNPFAPGAVGK